MKKYKVMDGNEACSYVSYLFSELAGIYPITPASSMAEKIDELSNKHFNNLYGMPVKVVEMQSEKGAIAVVHGALQSGVLATTYTASQGLLLMIPSMYKIAGEMLPCVINVAARSLATHALSIFGDHQDIYAARQTGFSFIASSSVSDVMNLTAVAYLSAIEASMPILNFFDGFRTSHEMKKIEILDGSDLKKLINIKKLEEFREKSLLSNKVIRGTNQNDDIYFQNTESRNKDYDLMPDIVNSYMEKINKLTGKCYKPFNYYGDCNASRIIIAMGSVCDTIREVVENEKDLGLVEVHLYRPFSKKYLLDVIPKSVKKIAVLDRTKEAGSIGEPLYLDVCAAFQNEKNKPFIIGGRYGLSSKDTDSSCIMSVFEFLNSDKVFNGFTVGINDDVTFKSIPIVDYDIKYKGQREILVYGYGSDGMVSASKDIISIMGNYTDAFVQGYFQYDSKKSGGVTISHLRISKDDITRPYYVKKANVLVCTKDAYLLRYDILDKLKKNGTFILASSKTDDELNEFIPSRVKNILLDKKIKTYVIDAFKIAKDNDIENKISAIMETVIFKLSNLVSYDLILDIIRNQIIKKFSRKGKKIVESNITALNEATSNIREFVLNSKNVLEDDNKVFDKVLDYTSKLKGNELSVKDFLSHKDGSFKPATSKYEKRNISDYIPYWIKENCLECNICSLVCPHGVIRPFILNKDEVLKYNLENKVKKVKNHDDLYFYIEISKDNCTGCMVCVNECPSINKALEIKRKVLNEKDQSFEIFNEIENKDIYPLYTIKGSQFNKPLFEFSGACQGCGQTPYLKLLTQLFGNDLVIANATGCSSIYGASFPSMPYDLSWSNSLFEDNAEYGYGIKLADNINKHKILKILESTDLSYENKVLIENTDFNNKEQVDKFIKEFDFNESPELFRLKKYLDIKSVWIVGGDGWAYDIGYDGIDQVLSTGDNVNILVLDTEVYSNTGGQKSKATRSGAVAKFSSMGKKGTKKDLAKLAMCYDNVYVSSISLGANMQQCINSLKEANNHNGPSIVIAYAPCINHGILNGMKNSIKEEKLAVECGYWPLFRYNPDSNRLFLDYKNPNFDKYDEFLNNENRYKMLKSIDEQLALELLENNKETSIKRFNYYKTLSNK